METTTLLHLPRRPKSTTTPDPQTPRQPGVAYSRIPQFRLMLHNLPFLLHLHPIIALPRILEVLPLDSLAGLLAPPTTAAALLGVAMQCTTMPTLDLQFQAAPGQLTD